MAVRLQAASVVAVIPAVRSLLVAQQQQMGVAGGIVMEGRDIGSVVFPRAEHWAFTSDQFKPSPLTAVTSTGSRVAIDAK